MPLYSSSHPIDISVPLRSRTPVWPGDQPFTRTVTLDLERGDGCTLSHLALSSHTGTHMDAPLHFVRGGATIDQLPLDAVIGPARVIHIRDSRSITREELLPHAIKSGERILFRTANSALLSAESFHEDYVHLNRDAAAHLAERGVVVVGIDAPSVGGFQRDGPETHRELLSAGVWIIENLRLGAVEPGDYELICLPLLVIGAEGSPARAVLLSRGA